MRAVYRALVAPLATAICHRCVRGWTFELGTSMWWTLTQTTLYHWFRGRTVTSYVPPCIYVSSLHPVDGQEIMDYSRERDTGYGRHIDLRGR